MTVAALGQLIVASSRIVAFTGAGISTESGIPDFRSPGGLWTRYDPREFTFQRYVDSADVRALSWAMRREFVAHHAEPNPAHMALAQLQRRDKLMGVITQNIDGLHQQAGSTHVIEIHGTARRVVCIGKAPEHGVPNGCGFTASTEWAFEQLDAGADEPTCPTCGGLIKSATISFGQQMPTDAVDQAIAMVRSSDLVLTIGSSLQVFPAADIPVEGLRAGAMLAIINDEPTPLDEFATVIARGRA
ncbi:MAG: Sir2 family NAD-dependent protein deacetylase, partial [Antricoccus sp.]